MQSSPSVRSALTAASRQFQIHNPAATLEFREDQRTATLGFRILAPGLTGADQLTAGAIAIATNALRSLCGPAWSPLELRFALAAPEDSTPYRRFFRAPLVFDASESCVVFADSWLDRAPPSADPLLRLLMEKRIAEAGPRTADDIAAQIRWILPAMVLAHDATLASVAARLGLGRRSLNRRLAAQATSLRALVEEARSMLAQQLLKDTSLAIYEIGERLGYANPSAFTRAFARWVGQSPAAWRAARRTPARRRAR
jgi:AraC-like DNA-binding protein